MVGPPDKASDETLDLLFDVVRDAPERQLRAQEVLDGKIVQVFAAATVILGLAGISGGVAETDAPSCLILAALGFYAIASGAAGYAIWPRSYRVTRHADVLWREYRDAPPRTIREAMVADAAAAYPHNAGLLRRKLRALSVALAATALEAAAVVFAFAW